MLAQHYMERRLSRAARLGHGLEENVRAFNRAVSAGAVNLPAPGMRRRPPAFYDNGKIGMGNHWWFNLADCSRFRVNEMVIFTACLATGDQNHRERL